MNNGKCAVCAKHKFELRVRKSKLDGHQMLVCNTCFAKKLEPRWLVILTAQSEGVSSVKDYLVKQQYYGPEIPAADLFE